MKIPKPNSDNHLLSLAAQPLSQQLFINSISTCSLTQLENALRYFNSWPWERGDLVAWAPVLNRFDDLYQGYIRAHGLGEGPQQKVRYPPG